MPEPDHARDAVADGAREDHGTPATTSKTPCPSLAGAEDLRPPLLAVPAGPVPEPLDLSELKEMTIHELTARANEMGLENAAGMRKHDLIFRILQHQTERNGLLFAEGVLECMPDGYGFLRAPESSYLPGPDDIYVSPLADPQVRPAHGRHRLRLGAPAQGGRALLRAHQGGGHQLRSSRGRQGQGPVRQPDPPLPERAPAARDRPRTTSPPACWT